MRTRSHARAESKLSLDETKSPKFQFQKKLFIKQPFPDNYVDASFLKELRSNVNVKSKTYAEVVHQSLLVSQQVSSTAIFAGVFILLYWNRLQPELLSYGVVGMAVMGYIAWVISAKHKVTASKGVHAAKSGIIFFILLVGLTPLLRTLTKDISSDTIWALSTILFLANLLFHDYDTTALSTVVYPESVSINAAMFASVLLASRLASNIHVFSLLCLAVEMFALFPIVRRALRTESHGGSSDVVMGVSLFVLACVMLQSIAPMAITLYIAATLFIAFAAPYWLIYLQKYKNEIRGPWDEARPDI